MLAYNDNISWSVKNSVMNTKRRSLPTGGTEILPRGALNIDIRDLENQAYVAVVWKSLQESSHRGHSILADDTRT